MPALTGAKNVCLHFEDTTAIISVDLTTTHGPNASASKTLIGTTLGYKPIGSTGALMWLTVSMEAGKAVDLSGDVPCPDGLKNCTLEVEGPMLKISVDLTQDCGASGSGKTTVIASTSGNKALGTTNVLLSLNMFAKHKLRLNTLGPVVAAAGAPSDADARPLRDYQRDIVARLVREEPPFVVQMASGTGKTEVFLAYILRKIQADPSLKVLVLVPTQALCEQTCERARVVQPGLGVDYVHTEHAGGAHAQVLVMTYCQPWKNLPGDRQLIIYDEAHHLSPKSKTNKEWWHLYAKPKADKVCFTATPNATMQPPAERFGRVLRYETPDGLLLPFTIDRGIGTVTGPCPVLQDYRFVVGSSGYLTFGDFVGRQEVELLRAFVRRGKKSILARVLTCELANDIANQPYIRKLFQVCSPVHINVLRFC
jgi:hypothetical protein